MVWQGMLSSCTVLSGVRGKVAGSIIHRCTAGGPWKGLQSQVDTCWETNHCATPS